MPRPNTPDTPVPRGRRIPLGRFWLDWRISFFLIAVCVVVVGIAIVALWGGHELVPSRPGSSSVMHRERAQVYAGLGKRAEAIREYRAALRLSPDDAELHRALALLFEAEGRFGEAIALYERSLRLEPASVEAAGIRTRIEVLRRRD